MVLFLWYISLQGVTLAENIEWVVANVGESQVESCSRLGRNPLYMDEVSYPWNASNFRTVVVDILNRTLLNTEEEYGADGCCAPGLWCTPDGCFTQGYADRFSNYGWLNANSNAKPVYTCSGSVTAGVTVASASLKDGTLKITGKGFDAASSASSAFVYGESCGELEFCNCRSCNSALPCPAGTLCITKTSNDQSTSYCFPQCAGVGDESCGCGYVCTVVYGEGPSVIAMCLPEGYNEHYISYHNQCKTSDSYATCSAPRAYQSQYKAEFTASSNKLDVSVVINSEGDQLTTGTSTDLSNGFCVADADCFDGNVCTVDRCNANTGLCQYTSVAGCDSVLPTVSARTTPYMYYTYRAAGSADLSAAQASSVQYLLQKGTESSAADQDDYPMQKVDLPFEIVYFGNLVSTGYISPNGVFVLPPAMKCSDGQVSVLVMLSKQILCYPLSSIPASIVNAQCFLITSASNVVAPFYTDWDAADSPGAKIVYYTQKASDPAVWGVRGRAFHLLFSKMVRYHQSGTDGDLGTGPNTFAASLYPDGSVRLSYVSVTTQFKDSDLFGLWGAHASSVDAPQSTALRYHSETVPSTEVVSGSEALYCSLGALACPVEACLATNEALVALWDGATSCDALGGDYELRVTCSFAGGVATSAAVFNTSTDAENATMSTVSCAVPLLTGFGVGAVVSVDILITAVRVDGDASAYTENDGAATGSKSVYVAYMGGHDEVARASLMIRYYSSSTLRNNTSCGCSALPQFAGSACDSMGVCGGREALGDCAGVAFGSAVTTDCSDKCVGGMTGTAPAYNCDDGGRRQNLNEIVTQTIVLLMVICCLMFLTVSVTYSIRRMLALRSMRDDLLRFNEQLTLAETEALRRHMMLGVTGGARGLSDFERDALGKVTFTAQFYEKHKRELAASLHGTGNTSPVDIEQPKPALDIALVAGDTVATPPLTVADNCECTICLGDVEEGNECRVLPAPCGHIFHVACIDQWFQQSFLCPLCKRNIRALLLGNDNELSEQDSAPNMQLQDIIFLRNNLAIRFVSAPSRGSNLARTVPPPSSGQALPAPTGDSGAAELVPSIRYARQQRHPHQQQRAESRHFSPNRAALAAPEPPSPVLSSGDVELAAVTPRIRTDDGHGSSTTGGDRAHIRYEGMLTRNRSDSFDSDLS
jgi:hypothetical protein